MGNFVKAGKSGEFPEGTMKKVSVQGHEILLVRIANRFYAASNQCPQMGGNLSQGKLEGTVVTCPRHSSQFDLSDGKVVRWLKGSGLFSALGKALKSPKPLNTYNVRIESDDVLIEI
jgi:3-phenylpropionate/trans-cinnamate dioxygenase ferredoxin subunit